MFGQSVSDCKFALTYPILGHKTQLLVLSHSHIMDSIKNALKKVHFTNVAILSFFIYL